ncbi:MAG: MFS transporter [Lachnospiraceae bacterium]|jgi:OFA family oxalate/formate antiporter-like MFS transporter|nr:MFS transporter [Lachnospiraceae bacterium]MCI1658046.1 MFS transporter [Lachnospiraceae bacterium]MCI2196190.1 MFS transporter [Lachnospiraceae bacterium]
MADKTPTFGNTKPSTGMYNFGRKGWTVVIYQVVWFFFMTGMTVDGLNIIVPQIAAYRGWDPNAILSISTPASIIALFIVVIFGGLAKKFGLKRVMVITMFAAGAATICYGNAPTIALYAVFLVAMVALINAFALTLGLSICTNWFPTKKGVIMGFTTIGMNLASALISQILNQLSSRSNIAVAITIMGCVIIIVGILTAIFIKDTPEKAGCYPDNDPEIAKLIQKEEKALEGSSEIGYGEALKNPKTWIFGIAYGFFGLATVGIMSQLAGYFMTVKHYSLQTSLNIITIAAVIGVVGSIIWGIVDQKVGTKKASILFGIWYSIGILLLLSSNNIIMVVGIVMLGAGIGGNGNFAPSMAALVYGRRDFPICYSVLNMIVGIVRSCSFVLLAILRSAFGGYTVPYVVFALIALAGGLMLIGVKVVAAVGGMEKEIDEQAAKAQ